MISLLVAATLAMPAVAPVHAPPAHAALPVGAVVHAQALAAPAAQHVTVPIVLPPAPSPIDATTNVLADARLAIARAQAIDPAAAQTASFEYVAAVEQYRGGNAAAAGISALQALATAGAAQIASVTPDVPAAPGLTSTPAQRPGTAGGLSGADAPAIDADAFIALARGTLSACAARHDRRLGAAQADLSRAQRDFAARDWQATRTDAKSAIDACATPQHEAGSL